MSSGVTQLHGAEPRRSRCVHRETEGRGRQRIGQVGDHVRIRLTEREVKCLELAAQLLRELLDRRPARAAAVLLQTLRTL